MEQVVLPEHPDAKFSISVGGVLGHDVVKTLLAEADKELYHAKETRNAVCIKVL